ncbi:MAG: hypothetical protein V1661_00775 [bacterium]
MLPKPQKPVKPALPVIASPKQSEGRGNLILDAGPAEAEIASSRVRFSQ